MRWALLGGDDQANAVKQMFAATPKLDLIRVAVSEWESLLVRDDFDAVFVVPGFEASLRDDLLKKLVGSAIPIVVLHPAVDVLTAYEIEVVRRDNSGTIIAFAPGWFHPAWDRLANLVELEDQSPLGRTEHISLERHVEDRHRETVLAQLSQDVRIVRRLLGNITSISAVGDSRSDGNWNSLTVHFVSDSGRSANWSISPPSAAGETRVRVGGTRGNATLCITGTGGQQTWEFLITDPLGQREIFPPWNDGDKLVAQVELAIDGHVPTPSWSETCLDLEIAEGVERSLRRKRAIDLYTTNRSEEKTFKGFMAASGCLVLVVILFGFLGLAMWDGFRAPYRDLNRVDSLEKKASSEEDEDWSLWIRLWPVYPLCAFLLLQFLLFIARQPSNPNATASAAGKSPQKE